MTGDSENRAKDRQATDGNRRATGDHRPSKPKLPEEKGGRAMMKETTGAKKPNVQDDHASKDLGPMTANKPKSREEKSQLEGPAAYAPHDESEKSNRDSRFSA
jgi:hypothetical protein